jgi:hypothetical protein
MQDGMQVADFYGVTLALSGIVVATEGLKGLWWVLGFCTLGSPVACAYIIYKVQRASIVLQAHGGYERQI